MADLLVHRHLAVFYDTNMHLTLITLPLINQYCSHLLNTFLGQFHLTHILHTITWYLTFIILLQKHANKCHIIQSLTQRLPLAATSMMYCTRVLLPKISEWPLHSKIWYNILLRTDKLYLLQQNSAIIKDNKKKSIC